MKIPAKYRAALYWSTVVVAAGFTVASSLGLVPADAIDRGVATGLQVLSLVTALLAALNVTPDQ